MKTLSFIVLLCACSAAWADSRLIVPDNAKWQEECGSCHIAYPPQLLTADDWAKLMQRLDRHFGANAELEPAEVKEISAFLQSHAGKGSRHTAASQRITDTAWFKREHHEVSGKRWADPAVKTRSNCSACHVRAEQGDWSERTIRMPGSRSREADDEGDDDEEEDD